MIYTLLLVAFLILLVSLPFGYWRQGLPRLSLGWFVAIHAPIPLAIGLRLAVGMGFRWRTLPVFVGAYFAGQFLGGRLRRAGDRRRGAASGDGVP